MRSSEMVEKRNGVDMRCIEAYNSMRFILDTIASAWLKNNPNVFAIRLSCLSLVDQELVEVIDSSDSSRSVFVNIPKQVEIIDTGYRGHWAERAVADENRPTPMNQQELFDFLDKSGGSTFWIFNLRSTDPPGRKDRYFLFYLGRRGSSFNVSIKRRTVHSSDS